MLAKLFFTFPRGAPVRPRFTPRFTPPPASLQGEPLGWMVPAVPVLDLDFQRAPELSSDEAGGQKPLRSF